MNNLIVSAGEDWKYKIWDSYGRQIFCSAQSDYLITWVSWSFNGDWFAVGGFNMLKLWDKAGWMHSFWKTNSGSIFKVGWSFDGRNVWAGCGNG